MSERAARSAGSAAKGRCTRSWLEPGLQQLCLAPLAWARLGLQVPVSQLGLELEVRHLVHPPQVREVDGDVVQGLLVVVPELEDVLCHHVHDHRRHRQQSEARRELDQQICRAEARQLACAAYLEEDAVLVQLFPLGGEIRKHDVDLLVRASVDDADIVEVVRRLQRRQTPQPHVVILNRDLHDKAVVAPGVFAAVVAAVVQLHAHRLHQRPDPEHVRARDALHRPRSQEARRPDGGHTSVEQDARPARTCSGSVRVALAQEILGWANPCNGQPTLHLPRGVRVVIRTRHGMVDENRVVLDVRGERHCVGRGQAVAGKPQLLTLILAGGDA
mmetsp:Transcript_44360/g.123644  ORF Transcript_44360/g.123644 Transcript_44360/m.123644 type:complete len:331 (-) Transcript_44360:651-1643(-)